LKSDCAHCRSCGLEFEYYLTFVIGPVGPVNLNNSPSKFHLETISRNKVYAEVAKQLQDRIVGELKPGDMLPSERELVQMLGVSRSSVRDAIRSLQLMGLLEPRQGVGTIVRDPSAAPVTGPIAGVLLQKRKAIAELLDFRKMLEPPLARRAALHASPEQISGMEEIVCRQEAKLQAGKIAVDEDSKFHYRIAAAAENDVVLKIVDILMDLLRKTREQSLQTEGRQQKSLAGHRRILEALKRRDPVAAEAAMHRHLSEIENIVLQEL